MKKSYNVFGLIIPAIIYVSDDTVIFGSNANQMFIYVKYLILLAIAVYLFFHHKKYKSELSSTICIVMCALILFSSFINSDIRMGLLYKIVILALSCLLTQIISIKEFALGFERFIYFIACCSIVGYSIAFFAPYVLEVFPKITNTANNDYYNLIVYTQDVNLSRFLRNEGCFREAGVFQMFLNLALVFQIYFMDTFKVKHFLVIIIALVLTFSTTGFVVLSLVLLMFLLSKHSNSISRKIKYTLIFIMIMAFVFLVINTNVFSMEGILLSKFQDDNESSIARLSSITSNIEIWRQNPIFGSGLKIDDLYTSITISQYGILSNHNTNTFLYELACWGVVYFIMMIAGIIRFCGRIGSTITEHVILFLIILFLSIGEKLVFSPFFYILLFYGYNNMACSKLVSRKKRL